MPLRVLITGFGPFPGAPINPTGDLVRRLGKERIGDRQIATHVFPTRYAAVDRDLPDLIKRHKPDILLMFGLAARARTIRIETRARNARAIYPDASGATPRSLAIERHAPPRRLPFPAPLILTRARAAGIPVALSRDAGRYLCNYLCWRACEVAERPGGPQRVAFVHVPRIGLTRRRRIAGRRRAINMQDLTTVGLLVLRALIAASRVG